MSQGYGLGSYGDAFGGSRFDQLSPFANSYETPGWQRAQQRHASGEALRSSPHIIEGELTARDAAASGDLEPGERIFHQKFGYGHITAIDGNKLTIEFDKAGEKRVLDSFVQRP